VIGGGFSRGQVAGALADFISGWRFAASGPTNSVTLLHDGERLLRAPASRESAARSLRRRGVSPARARAVRCPARSTGRTRRSPRPHLSARSARAATLVERLGVPSRFASSPSHWLDRRPPDSGARRLRRRRAADGQISAPTAQFAIAQAEHMARNQVAHNEGGPTRAFSHRSRGMMATTGHHKGVAQVLGVRLTGLPAWLLWRAYYLMRVPTLGRKVRIWVEWTWSLFFPADITHLRFTRTEDVDASVDLGVSAGFTTPRA
jgi:NADH dehydrogenase